MDNIFVLFALLFVFALYGGRNFGGFLFDDCGKAMRIGYLISSFICITMAVVVVIELAEKLF